VRYRALGESGLRISVLGMGCGHLGGRVDQAGSDVLVKTALDLGVNLFDTADVYGKGAGEEALGRALRGSRDQAVIATKVRWAVGDGPNDRGASRIHIRSAVEASLRRLGTDRIDLYQVHAPDPGTPVEETLAVLDDLVTSGKVLYLGASSFAGWQLVDAHWQAVTARRTRFISTQGPYSLLDRTAETEILPAARHRGIGFLACLVFGRGYLAGAFTEDTDPTAVPAKRRGYLTTRNRHRRDVIARFAQEHGLGTAAVALAAIVDRPGISGALAGATSTAQLVANAAAVEERLPERELTDLLGALRRIDTEE
jgi:aryl-alcohol dehydrogenase-like predicted oxidoreductase